MSAGALGALAGIGVGLLTKRREDRADREQDNKDAAATREQTTWEDNRKLADDIEGRVDYTLPPEYGTVLEEARNTRPDPNKRWEWRPSGSYSVAPQGPQSTGYPAPALPVQQVGAPPPQAPAQPQGVPMQAGMQAPQSGVLPGMAMGGPVAVDPNVPQEGALPAPAPAPQAQAPAPQGQQEKPPTYRETYKDWYAKTSANAIRAGGIEGLMKFKEMEDATNRRMVMGYGLQAVQALNEGNVGQAMRAGNAALEVTPFDTGMNFVAKNGQLHMAGADGSVSKNPLSADALRVYMEDNFKTPENYLQFKQQYETERQNKVDEGVAERTTKVAERGAAVNERDISLREDTEPERAAAATATSLAALENARSNSEKVANLISKAGKLGWKGTDALKIYNDTDQWTLNQFTGIDPAVDTAFKKDQQAFSNFKADVSELMLSNPWDEEAQAGSIGRDTASTISQLIRQPGGIDAATIAPEFSVEWHDDFPGQLFAYYDGKRYALPAGLQKAAEKNFNVVPPPEPEQEKPKAEGALPAEDTAAGQPIPVAVREQQGPPGALRRQDYYDTLRPALGP